MKELKHEQRKMARKARIKVLRGDRATIAASSTKLEKGELLLDTSDGYLIAGREDDTDVNNSSCIVRAREVIGYPQDDVTISASVPIYPVSNYGVRYDSSANSASFYTNNMNLGLSTFGGNISIGKSIGTLNVNIQSNKNTNISSFDGNISIAANRGFGIGDHTIDIKSVGNISLKANTSIDLNNNSSISSDGNVLKVGNVEIIGDTQYAVKIGSNISTVGVRSVSIGDNASANLESVAIGNGAKAGSDGYGCNSTAIGYSTSAVGPGSVAIGAGASASAGSSVQLGLGENSNASTLQFKSHKIANESTTFGPFEGDLVGNVSGNVSGNLSGDSVKVDSISNNSSTDLTISSGGNNVVINENTTISSDGKKLTVGAIEIDGGSGNSVMIGNNASARNKSIAIGNNSIAGGTYYGDSIAIGNNSVATGYGSCQIGNGSNANNSTLQFINTKIADGSGNVYTGFSKEWSTFTPYVDGVSKLLDGSTAMIMIEQEISQEILRSSHIFYVDRSSTNYCVFVGMYNSIFCYFQYGINLNGNDSLWAFPEGQSAVDLSNTSIKYKILT